MREAEDKGRRGQGGGGARQQLPVCHMTPLTCEPRAEGPWG